MKINKKAVLVFTLGLVVILGLLLFNRFSRNNFPQTVPDQTKKVAAKSSAGKTQNSSAGNVTIEITPQDLSAGKPAKFDISFDTHSVSLDFEVSKIAELFDSQNNKYADSLWEGTAPGGHHRSGTLTFIKPLAATGEVTLVLQNIAGVSERKFKWQTN